MVSSLGLKLLSSVIVCEAIATVLTKCAFVQKNAVCSGGSLPNLFIKISH